MSLKKEFVTMMIVFVSIIFILSQCSVIKKTPEQKAYEAREKQIADLQILRQEFPCDTSTVYITQTDTAFVTVAPDTVTRDGIKYVTKDRVITNTVTKQVTVVDSAAIQEMRLNNMQKDYLLQQAEENNNKLAAENKKQGERIVSLQKFKTDTWIFVAGIGLIIILGIIIKLKFL